MVLSDIFLTFCWYVC